MYDGPEKISTGWAELHPGDRELWVIPFFSHFLMLFGPLLEFLVSCGAANTTILFVHLQYQINDNMTTMFTIPVGIAVP